MRCADVLVDTAVADREATGVDPGDGGGLEGGRHGLLARDVDELTLSGPVSGQHTEQRADRRMRAG
jgi:hypothetical protein